MKQLILTCVAMPKDNFTGTSTPSATAPRPSALAPVADPASAKARPSSTSAIPSNSGPTTPLGPTTRSGKKRKLVLSSNDKTSRSKMSAEEQAGAGLPGTAHSEDNGLLTQMSEMFDKLRGDIKTSEKNTGPRLKPSRRTSRTVSTRPRKMLQLSGLTSTNTRRGRGLTPRPCRT